MRGGHLSTPIIASHLDRPVSRRDLLINSARFATAGSIALGLAGRIALPALAQDAAATPAGDYQELTVTTTEAELVPSTTELKPGYVLLTIVNQGQSEMSAGLLTMPDLTAESLAAIMATPVPEDEFPPFLINATIAGGPQDVLPGESAQVYVQVTPGNWAVFGDLSQAPVLITVSEGDQVGSEPETSITVQEPDFLFAGLDVAIPAGKQTWKVVNIGSQIHMLVLGQIPDGTTRDQVMEAAMREDSATPAAGALTEADVRYVGGVLLQSPGQTVWPVLDLAAGRYFAACWVPDPNNGGMPHAMEGMLSVFDVGA
jgi:hypothetical protein